MPDATIPEAPIPEAPAAGYQVVARRYRPQRFDELVGQEHVARGLSGAIQSGRVGHAYLFTGARGVGKTSAARIFAKALECTAGTGPEPCNACDKCLAIAAGQDVDVVEVDAASNRGIDEIRQLRQNVAVRPARGRHRIYIIDEVHMLTREAFNALLKTLEEPPSHVKFVLCTTEPEKLPITILSRCQRFDFLTVDAAAIARRLEQIVAAEGASVAPEALALIARRAAGSMRDSQSLLEQLLGSASGPIGVDEVHAVIGTGREEIVGRLVAAVLARDPRGGLDALDAALAGGADAGGVLEQVLAALRDALVASVGCGPERMLAGAGLGLDLAALGRSTGTVTLLAMLQIIDQALARMRSSGHAQVLAEMAVVRLASLEDLDDLATAVERVANAAAGQPAAAPARPTAAAAAAAAPAAARPSAPPAAADGREKKTTHLTPPPAAPAAGREAEAAAPAAIHAAIPAATPPAAVPLMAMPLMGAAPPGSAAPPVAHVSGPSRAAAPADADADAAAPTAADAADAAAGGATIDMASVAPLDIWHRAGEAVGGIAADFARLATAAAWRENTLEATLPASASSAAAFLRRTEIASGLARAVGEAVGRTVRVAVAMEPATAAPRAAAQAERPRSGGSQATLVRESGDHPLVSHARTLFDAVIRKVEPARPGRVAAAAPVATADRPPVAVADERDHSAADGEAGENDTGRDDPSLDGGADG